MKAPVDLAMSPPPAHARHWTLKALAGEIGGMDATTVRNILRRHGLKPHQVKTFKVSRDPRFEIKVRDVVGRTVERHRSAEFLAFLDHVAEGFFSRPVRQRLKNAVFDSLDACGAAIEGYIEHHNARDVRPFRWSRSPEDLVESWRRGHSKLQEMELNE